MPQGLGLAGGYGAAAGGNALSEIIKQKLAELQVQQADEARKVTQAQQAARDAEGVRQFNTTNALEREKMTEAAKVREATALDSSQREQANNFQSMLNSPHMAGADVTPAAESLIGNKYAAPTILPMRQGTTASLPTLDLGRTTAQGDIPGTGDERGPGVRYINPKSQAKTETWTRVPGKLNGKDAFAAARNDEPGFYDPDTGQRLTGFVPNARIGEAGSGTEPVYRVQTVDADGNMVTEFVTRSQAADRATSGDTVRGAPTSTMRDSASARAKANPIVQKILDLSESINTHEGLVATAVGAAAKQAAKVNLDDDVARYEALVQTFTPIWARAVGHTGVLTELDVQSARAILPKPTDSKSLRDKKVADINEMISGVNAAAVEAAGGNKAPKPTPPPTSEPAVTVTRDAKGKLIIKRGGG